MSEQGATDFEAEVVRLGLPLCMKSKAAAKLMSRGQTKLRELVQGRRIEGVKRDKDLLIRTASILRYNAELPPAEFASPEGKERHQRRDARALRSGPNRSNCSTTTDDAG
jgi:hypothetical protein